jgi:V8-like Glu-specific endopeptidase
VQVRDRGNGTSQLLTVPYGASLRLCPSERFWDQPSGSFCSGVLVAPTVIATAGHCIRGENIAEIRFVFGYAMRDETTPALVINNRDMYSGAAVSAWHLDDNGTDWALIRLDRPVVGHRVAQLRESGTISDEQPVLMIGHPHGLPAKAAQGTVQINSAAAYFTSDLPAYPGNSGSPVLNKSTHAVEGILIRGESGEPIKQGGCFVSRSTGGLATRVAAFAHTLPALRRNP